MSRKKIQAETKFILRAIIKGVQDKKGLSVTCMDLAKINSSICDYFIVCHGTSNTHVSAIAESIVEKVIEETGIKPSRREGITNSEWILIDYLDVVVHIFQKQIRDYYRLEDLWADAPTKNIGDEEKDPISFISSENNF